jgi:hypothetical protein
MKLTAHDLKQMNKATLARLSPEQLLSISERMLDDLQEAMDRLNQNSNNSSRPPSSTPPWDSNDTNNSSDPANQDNADDDMDPVIKHSNEDDDHFSSDDASLDIVPGAPDAPGIQSPEVAPTPPTKPNPIKRVVGKLCCCQNAIATHAG